MKRLYSLGFTFVELMLAASIFAIVAVVVYSTFGVGISVWKRAEKAQNLYQDIRLALDKMAQDLENAVLYSEADGFTNFVAEENKISFYSLTEVFPGESRYLKLRKVTYSLDESTQMVQRLEQDVSQSESNTQESELEEIAAQIESLTFYYCYKNESAQPAYEWKDDWSSKVNIPQGIKIELRSSEGESLVFSKYVFIPTGKKGEP